MEAAKQAKVLTQAHVDQALSYAEYRQLIDELMEEGKTTGPNQSESLLKYTQINIHRMKRWDKTTQLREDLAKTLEAVSEKWVWVVLTEGWCGDAAQNLPIIAKMAEVNPNIEFKLLLRDENLALMDAYLTNGGRSIPKLIALKADTLEELFTWGPRPAEVQELVMQHRRDQTLTYEAIAQKIHTWYAKDKGQRIQQEFLELIKANL